jgi:hypothetical protein
MSSKIKRYVFESPADVLTMHAALIARPGNHFYSVEYVKVSGELVKRQACTKGGLSTIEGTGAERPTVFNYVDMMRAKECAEQGLPLKSAWRSFRLTNLRSLTVDGIRYEVAGHVSVT